MYHVLSDSSPLFIFLSVLTSGVVFLKCLYIEMYNKNIYVGLERVLV